MCCQKETVLKQLRGIERTRDSDLFLQTLNYSEDRNEFASKFRIVSFQTNTHKKVNNRWCCCWWW
jgi:hypothetical protein